MINLRDLLTALPTATLTRSGSESFASPRFDSRLVEPGDLFFAIQGARDGHDFVDDAVASGALGVVVAHPVAVPPGVTVVVVDDTLTALQGLARSVRQRYRGSVVAISGSAGKTTLKALAAAVLATRHPTFSNAASFNNHLGVPMTLLGLDGATSCAVVEIGTNHRGEIADLADLVGPDVAVLTGVGLAHIGNFADQDELAAEKADLYRSVRPGGQWIVNGDDDRIGAQVATIDRPDVSTVSFGLGPGADLRAVDIGVGPDGTVGTVIWQDRPHPLALRLAGRHFVQLALAALAIGLHHDVPLEDGIAALNSIEPERGRVAITEIDETLTVIDDSYNASPDAVLAALDLLGDMPQPTKIAVLGEMRELGDMSVELHREAGRRAAETATRLIAIGADGHHYLAGALANGMDPRMAVTAETATDAFHLAASIVADHRPAVVLAKGSRFAHTERVVGGFLGPVPQCRLGTCTLYINCTTCDSYAPDPEVPSPPRG